MGRQRRGARGDQGKRARVKTNDASSQRSQTHLRRLQKAQFVSGRKQSKPLGGCKQTNPLLTHVNNTQQRRKRTNDPKRLPQPVHQRSNSAMVA